MMNRKHIIAAALAGASLMGMNTASADACTSLAGCNRGVDNAREVIQVSPRCIGGAPSLRCDRGAPVVYTPSDSDNDGVNDGADRCPGTAAGVAVNAEGCPLDTDADGVADYSDRCPGTAQGVAVDATGCEIQAAVIDAPTVRVLSGVNFNLASAKLTSNARAILNGVADTLKSSNFVSAEIAGHTDSQGTNENNQALSQRRAEAVVAYLSSRGVDSSKLTAVGYGESQPVATNSTRAGKAQNRRVELIVTE